MDYSTLENRLQQTVETVAKSAGWTVDRKIILVIASYFVASNQSFDGQKFTAILKEMKNQSSWKSPLRSNISHSLAATMTRENNVKEAVSNLIENEKILREAKFKSGNFRFIGAQFLTTNKEEKREHARVARALYEEIRKHHRFLTSFEDIPNVVLLSSPGEDVTLRAATMNRYYKELRTYNFGAGNDLQWLSQVLTLLTHHYDGNLVSSVVTIRDMLKREGIKVKYMHYSLLGFLAVLQVTNDQIMQIVELHTTLKRMKLFTWHRELVLFVSVQIAIYDIANIQKSLSMSILSSIEMILQAQQAIATATVVTAIATSDSGTS